jgi:hypothetical protein
MSLLTQGIAQVTAAAKAGMSERTARKYARSGRAPSQAKLPHTWRTRPDPFVDVWPEIEALLRQDGGLQAKTIWIELNERHADRFSVGQLRTLQRRMLAWRAKCGPDREVFFPQTHVPGEQAQSDFTDMRALEVMIAGQLFPLSTVIQLSSSAVIENSPPPTEPQLIAAAGSSVRISPALSFSFSR